ncbi:MAG: RiPP maturation radical SAM C-methyltransferase [bacterium]
MKENNGVAFIVMPMFSIQRPSVQLGLLKSVVEEHVDIVDDYYFNVSFAEWIGLDFYNKLSSCLDINIGDWFFSGGFSADPSATKAYLQHSKEYLGYNFKVSEDKNLNEILRRLSEIKTKKIDQFLDSLLAKYDWSKYNVIGFSCTFSQVLPSLSLAKLIKNKFPKINIVFGGRSVEGNVGIELTRRCDFVDCVVQGEGENAIIEILEKVALGEVLPRVYRSNKTVNIDLMPVPDYAEYYNSIINKIEHVVDDKYGLLPIESSRGCWWGEKKRCKFCGLTGASIKYKSKSPSKIIEEIKTLSEDYKCYDFVFVDNIFDHKYFKTLLPKLANLNLSYRFSFEIKANLKIEQIKLLREAGITWLQPGIESLNTEMLKELDKGATLKHNLTTLKWCLFYGIDVFWNLLMYIPKENEMHYQQMIELIPKIYHYPPPEKVIKLRLDRFSPYFELAQKKDSIESKHFLNATPCKINEMIYPEDWNKENLCIWLDYETKNKICKETFSKFEEVIHSWQNKWKERKTQLLFKQGFTFGHIIDTRGKDEVVNEVTGDHLKIIKSIEYKPMSIESIAADTDLDKKKIKNVCSELEAADLVIDLEGLKFWLPLPESN